MPLMRRKGSLLVSEMHFQDQPTLKIDYTIHPDVDRQWYRVRVFSGKEMYAALHHIPDETGAPIANVYHGSTIYVATDMRFGTWVVARVGNKFGWLDSSNVRLLKVRVQQDHPTLIKKPAGLAAALKPPEEPHTQKKRVFPVGADSVRKIIAHLKNRF